MGKLVRRGFKAEAERQAASLRKIVGCGEYESMHLPKLARHLKVAVVAADRVLGQVDSLLELHKEQPGAWSAATLELVDRTVVVYNPVTIEGKVLSPELAQRDGRTRSNIAHELSHIVLQHRLRQVQRIGNHSFFSCDAEQEAEANWLAGALLLPRPLLLKSERDGVPLAVVAADHCVTDIMVNFRLNATGARMQVARSRRK
jgi:hypothetical protein